MRKIKNLHFMGIGGSGMAGAASIASSMGYKVSGCDLEVNTSYVENIETGHSVNHLKNTDLLIVSPAVFYISGKHPEFLEAKKKGILMTWQELLGKYLTIGKKVICIAGTHGKSTTTAMAGKLLCDAGYEPSVMVGAKVPEWEGSSRNGKGDYFVIEADEFNNNFLNYEPEVIILNNIEYDHPDFFKSEEDMYLSYQRFLDNMAGLKILIANIDSPGVKKLINSFENRTFKVIGFSPKKEKLGFNLKIAGDHNIANALGVVKLADILGIKKDVYKKSLQNFRGIGRRMELLGLNSIGVKVYDDYAHHPTAVKATLEAIRTQHKKSKIITIYEPHSYSRTKTLLADYNDVFKQANQVIVAPIYKARDKETFGISEFDVIKASRHNNISTEKSFDKIVKRLETELKKGDVVVVMGAGKSYLLAKDILKI